MTVKSALRFVIAFAIVWLIMSYALPKFGIPRSRMLPAPLAYAGSATAKTQAYVTKLHTQPTSNIFHSTELDYLVEYQFRAPGVPQFGGAPPKEKNPVYKNMAGVTAEYYGTLKVGQIVPVKYDPSDPEINAIDQAGGGRNVLGHGAFLQLWLGILALALVIAYLLAPWLERLVLRESY